MFGKNFRFALIFMLFPLSFTFAQKGNYPYSLFGVGELATPGFSNNIGMGGIGVSNPTFYHINTLNPALLTFNNVTSFEFGLRGEIKTLSTSAAKTKVSSGNLQYLAFAFPITKKYTISVGLSPTSTVLYKSSFIQKIAGVDNYSQNSIEGDGGINNVYLSQGFELSSKFSIGLKAAYNFGAISKSNSTLVINSNQNLFLESVRTTNYKGFAFQPGLSYRQDLKNNYFLNLGATYDLSPKWSTNTIIYAQRKTVDGRVAAIDTIDSGIKSNKFKYPSGAAVGISFEKLNKFSIGVDLRKQDWEKTNNYFSSDSLKNLYTFSTGLQFTPDLNALRGIYNRIAYRAGFSYTKTQFFVNHRQVKDMAFNLGLSVPVGGLSLVNVAFTAGTRGTTDGGLLKEKYYRVLVGITLNDRWFRRVKYD